MPLFDCSSLDQMAHRRHPVLSDVRGQPQFPSECPDSVADYIRSGCKQLLRFLKSASYRTPTALTDELDLPSSPAA